MIRRQRTLCLLLLTVLLAARGGTLCAIVCASEPMSPSAQEAATHCEDGADEGSSTVVLDPAPLTPGVLATGSDGCRHDLAAFDEPATPAGDRSDRVPAVPATAALAETVGTALPRTSFAFSSTPAPPGTAPPVTAHRILRI